MAVVPTETVVGSHVLTIDGYTKTTAAHAVDEIIKSQRFRVAGHTWHIECCPRRVDEEGAEWVSVSLQLDYQHGAGVDYYDVNASPQFILLDRAGQEIQSCGFQHVVHTFPTTNRPNWSRDVFIERKALESYLLIQDDDCCRISCDVTVIIEPHVAAPPSQDLHGRNLGDLLLASEVGKDVTFVVCGEQFTAHSCVLAARASTAFMAEVLAGKEMSDGSRHVRVDGIGPSVFGALLHFIYTDSLPDAGEEEEVNFDVWMDMAERLLVATDRYDMERLKMICADVLCSKDYTATALPTLLLSHKLGCLKLNRACVKYIRDMLDCYNLEQTNRFQPGRDEY